MVDEKKNSESQLTAKASIKSIKSSPQKVNLVLQQIRGMDAERALNVLEFSKRRIANEVKKILKSAIANAENNHQLDVDKLYVSEVSVGRGMVMKRFRPRAKGRGARILKHFSNLTIKLKEQSETKLKEKEKNVKKDQKKDMHEEKR